MSCGGHATRQPRRPGLSIHRPACSVSLAEIGSPRLATGLQNALMRGLDYKAASRLIRVEPRPPLAGPAQFARLNVRQSAARAIPEFVISGIGTGSRRDHCRVNRAG